VPPDEFIKVAEHTALIRPLTHYVLCRAIKQCRAWQDEGVDLQMSVNLSVRNLLDFELTRDVIGELDEHGLDPSRLTLEITESSFMGDPARTVGVLNELAAVGIRLSVDDFGTGYSSMAYLNRLPVSEVKIDKSFVMGMSTDPSDAAIVRSIVDLGANLGLDVVAEGVEDQATWEVLESLGCFLAQGYLLSRALPADDFIAWLGVHQADATVRPIAPHRGPRSLFSATGERSSARDGNRSQISAKAT
jgi:EAL domain-containing protein (putative c-di-GMP-specific phosphodiesterase class I)